jgi:hypothetical protein
MDIRDETEMTRPAIDVIEGLIVMGIAVSVLARPQWFTKKDLGTDENRNIAARLRNCGWIAMACGAVFLTIGIATGLSNN